MNISLTILKLAALKNRILAFITGGKKEYAEVKEKQNKLAKEVFGILKGENIETSKQAKELAEIIKKHSKSAK